MKLSFLVGSITLLTIKLKFIPNTNLLFWLMVIVAIDFVTGVAKAKMQKEATTSSGFRKTIIKLIQYFGVGALVVVLGNAIDDKTGYLQYADDTVFVFMIYIEATSILENLVALSPNSKISKVVFENLLKLLTLTIQKKQS